MSALDVNGGIRQNRLMVSLMKTCAGDRQARILGVLRQHRFHLLN
jgi:hypothetical protein